MPGVFSKSILSTYFQKAFGAGGVEEALAGVLEADAVALGRETRDCVVPSIKAITSRVLGKCP
jgi:hypothetical protein